MIHGSDQRVGRTLKSGGELRPLPLTCLVLIESYNRTRESSPRAHP